MSVDSFKYRNWILEVEKSQTEELYKGVSLSGTERCNCGQCKEFVTIKKYIYPQEIKELFAKLGIDINKEFELCDYGDEGNGHIYSWWFHFVGKIIKGDDCSLPLPNGGYTMNLLPINKFFKVGFTEIISMSFFESQKDLVQVELWAEIPWNTSNLSLIDKNQQLG